MPQNLALSSGFLNVVFAEQHKNSIRFGRFLGSVRSKGANETFRLSNPLRRKLVAERIITATGQHRRGGRQRAERHWQPHALLGFGQELANLRTRDLEELPAKHW